MSAELLALADQLWRLGHEYLDSNCLDTPTFLVAPIDHAMEALDQLGDTFCELIPDHPTDDMPDLFYEPFTWRGIAQLAVVLAEQACAELSAGGTA